jgi:hypothetical protein
MPRTSPLVEMAAEAHFFVRPQIDKALKSFMLTDETRQHLNVSANSYHDLWKDRYCDKFHDITTMIRLGSAIEVALRDLFLNLRGHSNLLSLDSDAEYKKGIFQRIMPWQVEKASAYSALKSAGYDLSSNPYLRAAQEVMMHRHLYAHSSGAIDSAYIRDWKRLTGEDLHQVVSHHGYPQSDAYWFRPLERLNIYIENLRNFVRALS